MIWFPPKFSYEESLQHINIKNLDISKSHGHENNWFLRTFLRKQLVFRYRTFLRKKIPEFYGKIQWKTQICVQIIDPLSKMLRLLVMLDEFFPSMTSI